MAVYKYIYSLYYICSACTILIGEFPWDEGTQWAKKKSRKSGECRQLS